MHKIHCLNSISREGLNIFTKDYELTDNISEADGVLVRSADMHGMDLPDSLLAVARAGAGVNNIPLDECARRGIVVFNTPGANANGVKEIVIAGMLLAARDIAGGISWVKENRDDPNIAKDMENAKKQFSGTEIEGKRLGIIGLGAVGVRVANAAVSLGMDVYGYDPYLSVNAAWNLSRSVKHVLDVDEIYATCDYITIHVPLMDETRGMIDASAIEKMKDGVILLNYSRDLLVDEREVLKGLESGKIRRYVSDFANPVTAGAKGCIVTPHLGASTEESEDNCARMAVSQMMDYLENGNIENSVNYPSCDMGVCSQAGRVAIFHKNITNMISRFTSCLGERDINISNLTNKSKGDIAYTMMDLETPVPDEVVKKLSATEGVFRVRVIK